MSESVAKVLIIGGGFSGMSAAIQLRKQNIETHLLEIDPDWGAEKKAPAKRRLKVGTYECHVKASKKGDECFVRRACGAWD